MNSFQIIDIVYFKHAWQYKNITNTCRLFNASRTAYYEWSERFSKFGYPGLKDRKKSKPRMPNKIKHEHETIIYNCIISYSIHGSRNIYNELKTQGIIVNETGTYNVLRRKGLNHNIDRFFYTQEHSNNPVITEEYLREKRSYYSGYHIFQDIFYLGIVKGLGRTCQ